MSSLPPFLRPWSLSGVAESHNYPISAVFEHKIPLGSVHANWWPCKPPNHNPDAVLLFIPGNPGLVDFYTPFLSALYERDTSGKLCIFAHSYIGHTPTLNDSRSYGLVEQVQSVLEAFDAVCSTYSTGTKVLLAGHSVGSWVVLQVLKARGAAACGAFLLFPTLSAIASTPNGRRLSWLFRPRMRNLVASLSYIARMLPTAVLSFFFSTWPLPQVQVLHRYVCSSSSVYATLSMAHDEMEGILALDRTALYEHRHRIWMYFADYDDWIGVQRGTILAAFENDPGSVQVVHGHHDVPHAFCIS